MKKNEITVANKNNSLFSLGKKAKKKPFGKIGTNTNLKQALTIKEVILKPDGIHINGITSGIEINRNKNKKR